jgi:hypothetical protein
VRQPWAGYHVYDNWVLPHARLRQPWRGPEATKGTALAKVWRPWTPAMAAGGTAHGWTRHAGRLCRVPPWPQPHAAEEVGKGAGA